MAILREVKNEETENEVLTAYHCPLTDEELEEILKQEMQKQFARVKPPDSTTQIL